jgi:hypothetical protein
VCKTVLFIIYAEYYSLCYRFQTGSDVHSSSPESRCVDNISPVSQNAWTCTFTSSYQCNVLDSVDCQLRFITGSDNMSTNRADSKHVGTP